MSNQKHNGGRFGGKGYYIALILCAAAIGISGYLYYQNTDQEPAQLHSPTQTVGGDLQVVAPGNTLEVTDPTVPNTKPAPQKPLKTGMPVAGQTVASYAMDCLSYNATTRDWRTHDGIDIAAEAGTPVCAAADGTVYNVYDDDTMGTTVVIRHQDGYVTKYASLDGAVSVAPGDTVTLGQTIGAVGCTALLETELGDHLHFSVTCNGEPVDPADFFNLG